MSSLSIYMWKEIINLTEVDKNLTHKICMWLTFIHSRTWPSSTYVMGIIKRLLLSKIFCWPSKIKTLWAIYRVIFFYH
jgi:hypothetical protein